MNDVTHVFAVNVIMSFKSSWCQSKEPNNVTRLTLLMMYYNVPLGLLFTPLFKQSPEALK